jgi:hypothetical protein
LALGDDDATPVRKLSVSRGKQRRLSLLERRRRRRGNSSGHELDLEMTFVRASKRQSLDSAPVIRLDESRG